MWPGLLNKILRTKKMSEECSSIIVPIYKNKGDTQSCNNYKGIKLTSHIMNVWKRVIKQRL